MERIRELTSQLQQNEFETASLNTVLLKKVEDFKLDKLVL